jgi:hypothetical protein
MAPLIDAEALARSRAMLTDDPQALAALNELVTAWETNIVPALERASEKAGNEFGRHIDAV